MIPAWALAMMEELFVPEAESLAIYAAFTTPPTQARKVLIDKAVKALKAEGIWSKLDGLWLTAAADSQAAKVNWIDPGTYDLTAVNSPTFTADRGYQGDGATSYLDTGMSDGSLTHFMRDDASMFAWGTLEHTGVGVDAIIGSANLNRFYLWDRNASNLMRARLHDPSADSATVATALGSVAGNRASSTSKTLYKDGTVAATIASTSDTATVGALYLLRRSTNYNGASRVGAAAIGAALTDSQHQALHDAVEGYMVGVGAA